MKIGLFFRLAALMMLFGVGDVYSQTCGAHEVNQELYARYPEMADAERKMNAEIRKVGIHRYLRKLGVTGISDLRNGGGAYTGPIYEIPVVVHVIESSAANRANLKLTDEQIRTWIDNCNRMFATTYGNDFYAEGDGPDGGTVMPFRLVLAKRDPWCRATTAILRYNGSTIPNYDSKGVNRLNSDGVTEQQIRNLAPHWQDGAYYNIYLVTGIDSNFEDYGIMGWATFPNAPWTSYDTMMKVGTVTRAHESTLAHELGHAFGLRHTFNDDDPYTCPTETNCATDGDMVCDTELSISHLNTSILPTNSQVNSCTGQNYQGVQYNIMNYSNSKRKFTPGQRERALAEFFTYKGLLTRSKALLPLDQVPDLGMVSAQCIPASLEDLDDYQIGMSRVVLGDIDNSSDVVNKQNSIFYTDYTTKSCMLTGYTDLEKGKSHTLTIHKSSINPNRTRFTVWIDYNNDGSFSASEQVGEQIIELAQTQLTFTISLPTDVVENQYLRVRIRGDFFTIDRGPCDNLRMGEIEDYAIRVVSPCSAVVDETRVQNIINSQGYVGGYTESQLARLKELYASYLADKTNCGVKTAILSEMEQLVNTPAIDFEPQKYYRLYNASNGEVLYVDYTNNKVASRSLSDTTKIDEFWKLSTFLGETIISNPNTQTSISQVDGTLASNITTTLNDVGEGRYTMLFGGTPLAIAPEFRLKAIENIGLPIRKKYATFYYPFAVRTSDSSLSMYTINSVSDRSANATVVSGVVPANTPVIAQGEDGKVYTLNISYDTSEPTVTNNLLRGVLAPSNVGQEAFVIWTNENNETGFYQVAQAGILGANKAYLLLSNAGSSPYYKINISDGTTKIMDVKREADKHIQYYDLSGKPVKVLLPGVVYLTSEGKKVIFKQK